MSNPGVPLSNLLGPSLSPESLARILRERVAALESENAHLKSENADLAVTVTQRDNVIQLCFEELHRLTETSGLESPFREWMLSWPRVGEEEKNV